MKVEQIEATGLETYKKLLVTAAKKFVVGVVHFIKLRAATICRNK